MKSSSSTRYALRIAVILVLAATAALFFLLGISSQKNPVLFHGAVLILIAMIAHLTSSLIVIIRDDINIVTVEKSTAILNGIVSTIETVESFIAEMTKQGKRVEQMKDLQRALGDLENTTNGNVKDEGPCDCPTCKMDRAILADWKASGLSKKEYSVIKDQLGMFFLKNRSEMFRFASKYMRSLEGKVSLDDAKRKFMYQADSTNVYVQLDGLPDTRTIVTFITPDIFKQVSMSLNSFSLIMEEQFEKSASEVGRALVTELMNDFDKAQKPKDPTSN